MDAQKLVMGIVGLAVIIMVTVAVVFPAVENAQKDQYSTENNPEGIYSMALSSGTVTVSVNTTNGHMIINGVEDTQEVSVSGSTPEKLWLKNVGINLKLSTDTYLFAIRYWSDATTTSTYDADTIVYSNGSATLLRNDAEVLTVESDFFMYPDSKGTYGMYDLRTDPPRSDVYINMDSTVYVGASAGLQYGLMKGNYDDGFSVVGYSGDASRDTVSLTYTTTESDDGLTWQFASAPTLVRSDSGGVESDTTSGWVYAYVPLEYKYISDSDASILSLLGIIPLLLIIVAVLYAVRLMGTSRN